MAHAVNKNSVVLATLLSVLIIAVTTAFLVSFRSTVNSTTVALLYIFVIVLIATFLEWIPALTASIIAAFAFNFFFLEPYHTLSIDHPQNWVSLFVFLAVAVTVGHLSATSNRRRAEAERLYKETEAAFEKASEAEGLKRSEKLKTALLDAVTHDFRTPLTSIKASVTMLIEENEFGSRQEKLDRHGRSELLEVINEETDRLNTFVESMIEVARFQAGKTELRLSSVAADEIIVKAAKRARDVQRTHKLVSNVEPDLPKMSLDTRAIVEAVYNLINNAAKYSDPGTAIAISAKSAGGKVRFSVEDEGPGIPAAERESVFQRFYQSEDANGQKQGMGMGLAIVRGIIEAHGGEIWVDSGAKGARFVFDLPAISDGR
ncbi:MAG TPA: ATP-binding protein [Pyrinomonadaceae bacterium]|jgi:two-component system sensor histidine kinase KdpD|nr:ATP-binding protein [Pyrinomonadaceae bacterium]